MTPVLTGRWACHCRDFDVATDATLTAIAVGFEMHSAFGCFDHGEPIVRAEERN